MLSPERLIDSILEGYVEVDRDLRIVQLNGNAERLLRINRTEALGKPFPESVRDVERAHQWPQLLEAIQKGTKTTLSVFYPTQYVWHEVKVVPLDEGGAAMLMRDVTDRQWLIRREAERVYLRNVFETAPVAITIMRGPKHIIEYMNAFGRQLVGNRAVEGKPLREAFADIEQKEIFEIIDDIYNKGTQFEGRDVYVRFDRDGDGNLEEGWFDITYQPARDFDGKVSGVITISIEVTDRVRGRDADQPAS